MTIELGRLCVKIAGRDSNKKCVVVDVLDNNRVLIDGETRRRSCNIAHLEPLNDKLELKRNASHEEVVTLFKELGLNPRTTKPKMAKPRSLKPKKVKKKNPKTLKKLAKKASKSAEKPAPKLGKKKTVKKAVKKE